MCNSYGGRTGFFWLSLFAMAGAVILALVAVNYDQLTNVTNCQEIFISLPTMYCGWQEYHNKTETWPLQTNDGRETYQTLCTDITNAHLDSTNYCNQEKYGKAWIGLMFVGIFFGLLSMAGFLIDVFCCTSHTWALGSGTLFTLFVTLAIIVWAATNKCIGILKDSGFVNCHSALGTSWYLALGAALLGALSHASFNRWK